ncbi:MAG: hypothetical protein M3O30_01075 [Planctomycetota bacterium]|nr:hypothetical protein [Planctomycetota bacterium]
MPIKRALLNAPVLKQIAGVGNCLKRIRELVSILDPNFKYLLMIQQAQYCASLMETPRYRDPKRLFQSELQVFSQHSEDGIIREIFNRIGRTDRYFAEVGVGDGLENNTVYLLNQGWSGLWVDGGQEELRYARREFAGMIKGGRLKIVEAFVSGLNIAAILNDAGVPREFDLLSLDIDRNTFFLWKALGHLKPRVIVIEYNPAFPATDEWCVEDNPQATWDCKSVYYGASLKAYEKLGTEYGYRLVGCDLTGTNAFFVREDLVADKFCEPFTSENHYEPARYFLHRYQSFQHARRFSDAVH